MSEKNNLVQSLQKVWEQTSIPARISVVTVGALSIFLIAGLAYWSMQPHYVPLATNLNPQQSAEIVSLLDENGIANKLNFSGSGVLVDQNDWNVARNLTSQVADPNQFEDNPVGSSLLADPTTKDHRIARDLELRLAKTIGKIKNIESASVHLGVPEQQPFVRDQSVKTASVTVQMRPGTVFTRKLSRSVIGLVSNSVEGLKPGNVILSDTNGNSFGVDEAGAGVVGRQMEYRQQLENDLELKAESLLEAVLGTGRAIVRVTADIDFNTVTYDKTKYDSGKTPASETIETTKGTRKDIISLGAAGTSTNLGGSRPGQGSDGDVVYDTERRESTYENGKTTEITNQQPGTIKRLTVAATVQLVDDPDENANADPAVGLTPAPPQITEAQVKSIIETAIGFDVKRNDQIEVLTVTKLAGVTPLLELVEAPPVLDSWMPMIKTASLGIAAFVALFLGLFTIKRIKPIEIAGSSSASITPQRARQLSELATLARKNPELLSSIMSSWINDDASQPQSGTGQARNAA